MLNIADRQPQGQTDLILTPSALPRFRRALIAEGLVEHPYFKAGPRQARGQP
jgi:hypothetical protein